MGEAGTALKVAQKEGDPSGFESTPAVVNGFLQDGTLSYEFTDFGIDLSALLLPLPVADDFCVGLPVGQLMGSFGKGVKPGGHSGEQLKEPCPHGVGRDA